MAQQINVFLENKPGRLEAIAAVLLKAKINIIAFTIQDRGDFGLMKLLVHKPQQAYLALADKGFACAVKEVLAISVKDKPGNLHRLAKVLMKNKVNIVDAHGFVTGSYKQGVCCLDCAAADTKKISKILAKEGFKVLSEEALYEF
jgi:hypothetical protein